MKTFEEIKKPTTWIARVNLGRQMRDAGEKMVADALRERLNKVGEAKWLVEVEREWGWSRTTAYRHLNPELLQKDRDRAKARYENRNAPLATVEDLQRRLEPDGDLEFAEDCAGEKTILQKKTEPKPKPKITDEMAVCCITPHPTPCANCDAEIEATRRGLKLDPEPPADLIRTKPTWSCCTPRRGYWMGKVEHWSHDYDCPTQSDPEPKSIQGDARSAEQQIARRIVYQRADLNAEAFDEITGAMHRLLMYFACYPERITPKRAETLRGLRNTIDSLLSRDHEQDLRQAERRKAEEAES